MKAKTLNVYLGWDSRETQAYAVARNSIISRTKEPLKIIPVDLKHIDFLNRPIEWRTGCSSSDGVTDSPNQMWDVISDAPMSTQFAISRFAVPFLQQNGWCLFADCDIICWEDIAHLFAITDDRYAVMVVKHQNDNAGTFFAVSDIVTQDVSFKMDGQLQTYYSRKNWSSVVLWNCDHPANKRLTIENLNTWPGRDLHAFKWLEDSEIGELPKCWNWLVNVSPSVPVKYGIWHYTLGGPWISGWTPKPYDQEWLREAHQRVAA